MATCPSCGASTGSIGFRITPDDNTTDENEPSTGECEECGYTGTEDQFY